MINAKLFIVTQYLLPQHLLSRAIGLATNCRISWFKNTIIKWFIKRYHVNMQEALLPSAVDYHSFNDFFTRKLRQETRIINSDPRSIICPVDGSISQLGAIRSGRIIQAKGFDFTLAELLGGDSSNARLFNNGLFATLYLSPKDYHCVHMPFAGTLQQMIYIPGDLFSVNKTTVTHVPRLFARNERVVCLFTTEFGPMAIIFVGAFFVASIHTVWAGGVPPARKRVITKTVYNDGQFHFNKGDLLGHFQLGSTVIVLLPENTATFYELFENKTSIKMGEVMAKL